MKITKTFQPTRLYVKRHTGTGLRYFGKSTEQNIERYKGSGVDWILHLDTHSKHYVVNDWVSTWFYDKSDLRTFALAFSEIFDIVNSPEWANKMPENGSDGGAVFGTSLNKVLVKDADGKNYKVPLNDPRYLSGELLPVSKGMATLKDKNGVLFYVAVDDPRFVSGELSGCTKGRVTARDKDGNHLKISVTDPLYLSGELVPVTTGINKGTVSVKDKTGKVSRVTKDDPRYLSGEVVPVAKGMTTVKDKSGNKFRVAIDDPRYLSGELVGVRYGIKKKLK